MRVVQQWVAACLAATCLVAPAMAQQKKDAAGCADHPLLTRLPDYWINACTHKQFDAYKFSVGKTTSQVEGEFWNIRYLPPDSMKTKPSTLQMIRNVENAVKQVGGKTVYSDGQKVTMTLTNADKELWVEGWADYTGKYILTIVQKGAMEQQLVASADAFAAGLRASGHITVDGIYFDSGKTALKPESQKAIGEIVKLLKADGGLKVFVVGHTDNVGGTDSNMKLSAERAQAVVQALVKGGIDAGRMKSFGNGPYAPVASNDQESGRAKNRRVELVKQ
ncbi:MAG TPA: OmpA family protein [Burkholderiales bacterium]|nr:OmpA family protein [Burkholderiales bacterium]